MHEVDELDGRKTPLAVHTDERGAFFVRMHMSKRGMTAGDLASAMLLAGIENAPSRQTIERVVRENAVPRGRHQRAIAEFFLGAEKADPTVIWRVPVQRQVRRRASSAAAAA